MRTRVIFEQKVAKKTMESTSLKWLRIFSGCFYNRRWIARLTDLHHLHNFQGVKPMSTSRIVNPFESFQSPQASAASGADGASAVAPNVDRFVMIGELVVRWEKLRWVYNAILAGVTLLTGLLVLGASANRADSKLWTVDGVEALIFAFLGANACFTIGPLIDGYLSWFGFRKRATTWVLFLGGTLISIGLTAIVAYVIAVPHFFPGMP